MSTGVILGIVFGCLAFVITLGIGIICIIRKRRSNGVDTSDYSELGGWKPGSASPPGYDFIWN